MRVVTVPSFMILALVILTTTAKTIPDTDENTVTPIETNEDDSHLQRMAHDHEINAVHKIGFFMRSGIFFDREPGVRPKPFR